MSLTCVSVITSNLLELLVGLGVMHCTEKTEHPGLVHISV